MAILSIFCFISVAGNAGAASESSGRPIETWLISGQSNAVGFGKLPGPKPSEHVLMYDVKSNLDTQSGRWVIAKDPMPMMGPNGVGPWVASAQAVASRGYTVRLTGAAWGGKRIEHWNPGEYGSFILMKRARRTALGARAFLWYQGESDANQWMSREEYAGRLRELIGRVRRETENPEMTAVIIQITAGPHAGVPEIGEGQRQFVMSDTRAILVPAVGCEVASDEWHLTREGYLDLGDQIGRAMLRTVYGKKDIDWPGPVMDAAVISGDGMSVTAHFAEVEKMQGCRAEDFAAMDSSGLLVDQRGVRVVAENTRAVIHFEKKIDLPAVLVYGFRGHPQATLRDEAGNRAPTVMVEIGSGKIPADRVSFAPNGAGKR